jgi:hypothetical protein
MKISEFRKLIREEVRNVVGEAYSIPPTVTGNDFDKAIKEIITNIEKEIKDGASTAVKVIDYPQPQSPIGPVLQYDKKAFKAWENRLMYYQLLRTDVVNYLTERDPKQKRNYEESIRYDLTKYWKK